MKYLKKSSLTLLGVDCGLYTFLKSGAGVWECYCKENTQGGLIHITSHPLLNLHLFPCPTIGCFLSLITFWTRHCEDQISSQPSINFPKQILQYSQHICVAGINVGGGGVVGVCVCTCRRNRGNGLLSKHTSSQTCGLYTLLVPRFPARCLSLQVQADTHTHTRSPSVWNQAWLLLWM